MLGDMFLWLVANLKQGGIYFIKQALPPNKSAGSVFWSKLNMHCYKDYGGISYWVGDGFCDDINNNEACDYDDGDCCGLSMKKNFCVKCVCKGKSNSF